MTMPATRQTLGSAPAPTSARRILAVVLPQLPCELAQRLHTSPHHHAPLAKARAPFEAEPASKAKARRARAEPPRAVVLVNTSTDALDGRTELDAVNPAAHLLGVRPHQQLAQARASVEGLVVQPLLRSQVQSALAQLAEVLLRFGSPVSFRSPDTLWVDITGSSHLYPSEQELSLEVLAQIKAMGHAARVAVAPGPWLARAFAQHLPAGPHGILRATPAQSAHYVEELPIIALPIQPEAAAWFARLGLLSIGDLKKLPVSSLAGRLEGQVMEGGVGDVLELLQGRDHGLLVPHQPEEAPREELFWEDPLEASEPLLFILKGLAARLSARLEGRGQAARELRLTLHYDRGIAAARGCLGPGADSNSGPSAGGQGPNASNGPSTNRCLSPRTGSAETAGASPPEPLHTKSLCFKLATPLFHAEDLERVMRLRLQRQKLPAPTVGLSLQAKAITEAHHSQMALSETAAWRCGISTDARSLTVLLAELSADIGAESVGRLVTLDSHLFEKSCRLQPISADDLTPLAKASPPAGARATPPAGAAHPVVANETQPAGAASPANSAPVLSDQSAAPADGPRLRLPQLPTRLLDPAVEIHAPIRKNELWVLGERAYVVHDIRFELRLESVEWWESSRVFRDYFRVWLVQASARAADSLPSWRKMSPPRPLNDTSGLEALVYRDRERGKSYLHALFD